MANKSDNNYVGRHAAPQFDSFDDGNAFRRGSKDDFRRKEAPTRSAHHSYDDLYDEVYSDDSRDASAARQRPDPDEVYTTHGIVPADKGKRRGRRSRPEQPAQPKKSGGALTTVLIIIIIALVIGMFVAGYHLAKIYIGYKQDQADYSAIADYAIIPSTSVTPVPDEDEPEATPFVSEIPLEINWDYLRSVNEDVVGWLYCPNTVINYPVLKSDDYEYYLNHGFDNSSNGAGALFINKGSINGDTLSNYIIYGHHMKDDSMFGTVADYVSIDHYYESPILYYMTPEQSYRIELFGARYVEADSDAYVTEFEDTAAYEEYLADAQSEALWWIPDVASTDYEIFSMSTCVYPSGYVDPRLLVQGIMVPIQ